mmetsp:Transcript_13005/g.26382  ORF Transcript_13005/g.26382 Transcript_13005/m.26382 type:complete len:135 (-) Transcript_13005:193-597(-)
MNTISRRMVDRADESKAEVTREDQDDINRFARLLAQRVEQDEAIESRQALLKLYEDAIDEMAFIDDEEVLHNFGDSFVMLNKDEAEESLETKKSMLLNSVASCEEKLSQIRVEMATLKSKLYGKFGKSINLEES